MPNVQLNPPIAGFMVRIGFKLHDANTALLTGVHLDTATPYGVAVRVDLKTGAWREIGRSDPLLKDDSVSGDTDATGAVYLAVSETAVPGGGGATSQVKTIYHWPAQFPPLPAPVVAVPGQDATVRALLKAIAKVITGALGV